MAHPDDHSSTYPSTSTGFDSGGTAQSVADPAVVPLRGDVVSILTTAPGAAEVGPPPAETSAAQRWTWTLLLALLGFLLASFPARNADVWLHLAKGSLLAHGQLAAVGEIPATHGWLVDLLAYGVYAAFGGAGLLVAKALIVAGIAFLLLRLSQTGRSWWLALFCATFALVVLGTRVLLQPAIVSYFLLALMLWLLPYRAETAEARPAAIWSSWPLMVLFLIWANVDTWFVLGLAIVALIWLGQLLEAVQRGETGIGALASRRLILVLIFAAACLLNPAHILAFTLPAELSWMPYWSLLAENPWNPAAWAYPPLLLLGALSFVLNLPRWHWQRFLPWLGLALLSVLCARAIPFFAIVAGPVLAWNIEEFLGRIAGGRLWLTPSDQRWFTLGRLGTGMLIVVLLIGAWPGWLQLPPYGPRVWAVETSPSLAGGATAMRRWLSEGKLGPDARGLHLTADTVSAFAWFCPEAKGVRDETLAALLRDESAAPADWRPRLRQAGVNHVIVYDADPDRFLAVMVRLLEAPREWPLLYVEGYLAVFGWRDPATAGKADPFASLQLDVDRLAFHPAEDKKAPHEPALETPEPREWYEAFWKPAPARSLDQDEATLYSMYAEIVRRSAPERHLAAWEASRSAALVAAAASWMGPAGSVDACLRLTLIRPRTPMPGARLDTLPGLDQLALGLQGHFTQQRDDTSPALLYLAVRAARRALAANPDAAQAHLVLGESYTRLLHATRERDWGQHLGEITQLRQVQAIAALNHAVTLRPNFVQAHYSLYRLYGEISYLDLALKHFRAYRELSRAAVRQADLNADQLRVLDMEDQQFNRFEQELDKRESLYEVAAAGKTVLDKSFLAMKYGLAGKARDLLLDSTISAFGDRGLILELELLLRTGRPEAIAEWTSEEHRMILGPTTYHWFRTEAFAAIGNYERARQELDQLSEALAGPQGNVAPLQQVMAVTVGRRVLDEYALNRSLPDLVNLAFSRVDFLRKVSAMRGSIQREADVIVLRGLLALEEGDADEAEKAFGEAVTYWKSEEAAATGAGIDFNGRPLAQAALEWLRK